MNRLHNKGDVCNVQKKKSENHSYHPKKYSEGDRNTAAIAGAVAGYFIAKNTWLQFPQLPIFL